MIIRLACAAFALTSAAAAPAHADLSGLPGRYTIDGATAPCRLRLDAPASTPQDSAVEIETLSGLVLAFPGCPAGLGEAMLWRAPVDGSSLTLIDGSGAVVFEARPGERRAWTGESAAGPVLTLNPA